MTAPVVPTLPVAPSRSNDPDTFVARADAHVAALTPWTTAVNALGTWVNDTASAVDADAAAASGAAGAAADSAASAANSAASAIASPTTNATSTTSLTIGIGSKSLTIQTGKNIVQGMFMIVNNSGSNWMFGQVTSYNSGTGALVLDITKVSGSGTYASWIVSLTSPNQTQGSSLCLTINAVGPTNILTGITYLVDTSANVVTLRLPTMPVTSNPTVVTEMQQVAVVDLKGTFNTKILTILPATGQNIMGGAVNEALYCNQNYDSFLLGWTGTEWRFF